MEILEYACAGFGFLIGVCFILYALLEVLAFILGKPTSKRPEDDYDGFGSAGW